MSDKKTIKPCIVCEKEFESWIYRNSTCCSRKCASTLSKGIPKPTLYRPENIIDRTCIVCGKSFQIHKHFLERKTHNHGKFCCRDCKDQWMSEKMRGENNRNYTGTGKDFRGPNWGRQKRKAIKRDNNICQICGIHAAVRNLDSII